MKQLAIILLSVFMGFSACSPKQNISGTAKKNVSARVQPSEDVSPVFYNAVKEKNLGNMNVAASLFAQCINKDPKNAAALYNLAQIYIQQNRYADALDLASRAAAIDEDNVWYQRLKAEAQIRNNKFTDAAALYDKLIKKYPDEQEYYYNLITTFLLTSKIEDAIAVYNRLEARIGITLDIISAKEKLYIKMGKIDKAAAELQKLINAFPNEARYYGMLADLYQANGMMDKAFELLKKIETIDPQDPYLHLSLADYYRTKGDNEKSFNELKLVFANKGVDLETKFKILASYFNLIERYPELTEQSITLNKIMVETHPDVAAAHAFYGEFLYRDKKINEAREEYRKAKALDKKTFSIWQSLLRVELDLKDYHALIKESDEAKEYFPLQMMPFYLGGIARIQLKQYEDGIKILNEGSKLVTDDKPLLADFYSNIGEAYYRMKKIKESDSAFDKALDADPKNATTLNNYSYYLSLRGDSLDKAERMSKLSNAVEPNNSYYQDTYGWILYKKAKYIEAKEWIEKAMQSRDGESGVIFEHYGDIVYKLGDIGKAYEYWEKAKKVGGASEFIDKKLIERKIFE